MLTPELLRRNLTPLELTVLQFVGQGITDPVKQASALAASAHTAVFSTDRQGNITSVHTIRRPMTGSLSPRPSGGSGGGGFGVEKSGPMVEGPARLPTPEELAAALVTAKRKLVILARRNGDEPERAKPPSEPVHRPLVGPVKGAARNRVRKRRKLQAAGKPVTVPDTLPTPVPKEERMPEDPIHEFELPDVQPETFTQRAQRLAEEESATVLADLVNLQARARQVGRVLRALDLPVPEPVSALWEENVFGKAFPANVRLEAAEAPVTPDPTPDPPEPVEAPQKPQEAPEQPAVPPPPPAPPGPPAEEETLVPPEPELEEVTGIARDDEQDHAGEGHGVLEEEEPLDEMPERLQGMPAAKKGGPLTQRIRLAEDQLRVLTLCEDGRRTFVLQELLPQLPTMNQGRLGDRLRELSEAGLIETTGANRYPPGVSSGKPSKEYRPKRVPVQESTAVAVAHAKAEEAEQAGRECPPECLAKVRDYVQHQKEPFTALQVSQRANVKLRDVLLAFKMLGDRHSIEKVDDEHYRFCKPTDPGDAARLEQQRRQAEAASNGRGASSQPVAGTGGRLRGTGPHAQLVNELLDGCYAAGITPTRGPGGHFVISTPETGRVLIASSPSTRRAVLDARTNLRAAGVPGL